MDIFELIHDQHEEVLDIVQKMMDTKPKAGKKRRELIDKLKDGLLPHMYAEENYFYPVVDKEANSHDLISEAMDQHKSARRVLSEIESATEDDERWNSRLTEFKEMLEEHIDLEESDVFDRAREVVDEDRADEMGDQFESMEEEAKAGKASY